MLSPASSARCVVCMCACLGVALGIASSAWAAAPHKVDPAKLKKGDKLEVQIGNDWVPAEFVDQMSPQMIRVMREPFKTPVGALVDHVRLPKRRKTSTAAASAENPFETEVKPRKWRDSSGKFEIEGTFLRVEGDNLVLSLTNGKVITVPIDRLSKEDRRYLADEGSVEFDEPAEPEIPLVETHLGAAELIELTAAEWTYQPDKQAAGPALRNVRLPLAPLEFAARPQQILLAPAAKGALVVTLNQHGGQKFGLQTVDFSAVR